jgi:sugar transferase (PEP-CTERM/EpsH1 system associated)
MRILFVAPYIPSLIRVRPYNLIRALVSAGHSVHLVALQPPEDHYASVDGLQAICEQVDVFPLSRARTLWNAFSALPTSVPLQAAYSHHPSAERHLQQLINTGRYDVLHVEHLRGAVLASSVTGIPRVFDSVDSIAHLFEQASRLAPKLTQRLVARMDLGRTRRFEGRMPLQFERTLVTSPSDAQALRRLAGGAAEGRVVILPNGVDLEYFYPSGTPCEPASILFSGKMSYHANSAAALYLARDIMPRIWLQRPDTKLILAGKDPSPAVRELGADPRVEVTGYVDDLRPYLSRATVAVSPLLYGAGIQNKVLEAMACGIPVVVAPRVCDALRAQPGQELLVAENAERFAAHALDLMSDPIAREELGQAGRRYVERHHNWLEIVQTLISVYESIQSAPARPAPSPGSKPVRSPEPLPSDPRV